MNKDTMLRNTGDGFREVGRLRMEVPMIKEPQGEKPAWLKRRKV